MSEMGGEHCVLAFSFATIGSTLSWRSLELTLAAVSSWAFAAFDSDKIARPLRASFDRLAATEGVELMPMLVPKK